MPLLLQKVFVVTTPSPSSQTAPVILNPQVTPAAPSEKPRSLPIVRHFAATPTTEIRKEFTFEAAHRLPNVPDGHKCKRLHGHSFRVTIAVRGPVDAQLGWIVDFSDLKDAWAPLHTVLDHNFLNDVEGLENPTSENLAAWILQRIDVKNAAIHSITVSETCTSACTVYVHAH